tara:strand:- start:7833 stop:8003 length:171 start_codon:yes stop_codon:yes gene_type:complete
MGTDNLLTWLAFGTLIAAFVIALVLFLRFMRKPKNRHPMDGQRERDIEEIRDEKHH